MAPLPSCSGTRMSESLCRCTFYLRLKLLATKLHHLSQITKSVFGRLRNIVNSRSLHLGAIPLLFHGPFSLLITFDASQFLVVHHCLYLPELRCIHYLCRQMLLDDFFQIASPCLLVPFGNEWRTLLTVEGVPCEWLEVEMPEE